MHYRWDGSRLIIDCIVRPRAREDRVVGVIDEAVRIRITAPPVDGKANAHLIRFLAQLFQVKQSAITIVSGQSGPRKRVSITDPVFLPEEIMPVQRDLPD